MAVVAVAEDSARYDSMDAATNISGIGGGAGAAAEPDIFYQGAGSISRKVTGGGFYSSTGAARNMTTTGRRTWLVKVWVTNYAALDTTGLEIRLGSTSGTADYYMYRLASSNAGNEYPPRGGFIIEAIDPNIAGHRDGTTGTPNLTAADVFGCYGSLSATSKGENLVMDAIDVGVGLYLTGGDGGDTDGTFQDFVDDDEGELTNGRFGYVTTVGAVLVVRGRLIIGATSASGTLTTTAAGFTDSGKVISFPDNLAAPGFSGLTVDLGNASTDVNLSGCTFLGLGVSSPDDTRPYFEVFGTSGALDATGCAFSNFSVLTLTSAVTLTGCSFRDCETITHGSAVIDECVFNGHPTATGVALLTTSNPALISDCTFDNTGGTGHAIEIDTPGTYTFTGNQFVGYGADASNDAAIYNNSGGAVTINITGGGSTPTVRNGAGASTTVNSNVSITLTGLKNPSEVRVFNAGTTTEISGTGSENVTTGSHTFSVASGTSLDISVLALSYQNLRLLNFSTTSDTSVPISQVLDRQYENP